MSDTATKNGERTHEPQLRQVVAEMDGFRRLVEVEMAGLHRLLDERDRLYKERDESRRSAVDAAITAAKEQTRQSFEASEKAIVKAEDAQREYNVRSNEFRGQLDDQAKTLMPRAESMSRFEAFDKVIEEIKIQQANFREWRSESGGRERQGDAGRSQAHWLVGVFFTVVNILMFMGLRLLGK